MDPDIQVVSLQSPEEALQLLSSEPFDCVVSDILLPGIDGLYVTLCKMFSKIVSAG